MQKELSNYAFIDDQNFYKSVQELEKELEALEVELDLMSSGFILQKNMV